MRLLLLLPALILCLPTPAPAKSLKRMSDDELMDVLATDRDEDRREDAAKLLGDHKAEAAVSHLSKAVFEDFEKGVCGAALGALEEIGSPAALDEVQAAFEHEELDDKLQAKALKILMKLEPRRSDHGLPHLLSGYRSLNPGFTIDLLAAMVARNRGDARDLPLLMVLDTTLKRRVRLKSLDAAEALQHPRIYDAYISLLTDKDKKLKIRCIKGLSRSGLPGNKVGPALLDVVRNDEQGDVRSAALKALAYYAHPDLLPMVHYEVLNEKHPIAWGRAMSLLEALADTSSIQTITSLLARDEYLLEEAVTRLIHVLVRIGDPSPVPDLEALERRTQNAGVAREARAAIDLLRPQASAQREQTVSAWGAPPEVVYWDPNESEVVEAELSMHIGDNGVVVTADGQDLMSIYAGELGASAQVGGVSVSINTHESSSGSVSYQEPYSQAPAPCADAELLVNQVEDAWFDLYINGKKRIEARVGDEETRVGGLAPGSYHIRVTDFMGELWSEGRLELRCGDSIAAEVAEDRGIRILNYPEWYTPQ